MQCRQINVLSLLDIRTIGYIITWKKLKEVKQLHILQYIIASLQSQ